jgi:hypothetical protein
MPVPSTVTNSYARIRVRRTPFFGKLRNSSTLRVEFSCGYEFACLPYSRTYIMFVIDNNASVHGKRYSLYRKRC